MFKDLMDSEEASIGGIFSLAAGCLILIFCGLIIYQEKQTAGELSGWLTVGLLFLRSKDSIINLPKRRL